MAGDTLCTNQLSVRMSPAPGRVTQASDSLTPAVEAIRRSPPGRSIAARPRQ